MSIFISFYHNHSKSDLNEVDFRPDNEKKNSVWDKLQKRETFTKNQIPPYRVELETIHREGELKEGEKNIHHGPFLSEHGEIGKVSDDYRVLNFYYGSYVLIIRLIRPVLLEFYKIDAGIKIKLHSYAHIRSYSIWRFGNNIFWKQFRKSFLY